MWFAQTPTVYDTTDVVVVNTSNTGLGIAIAIYYMVILILAVIMIIAMWKMFEKAGEAGWKAIVPFYNAYTLCKISGRNGWWFLALFVPIVSLIVWIMISLDLAKHFGKSDLFGIVGLFLFSIVGYLMLGFGDAKYVGTKHA